MLHFQEIVTAADGPQEARDGARPTPTLTLTFEQRRKSRLLARLDDQREVALLLPRGTTLRHGDRLRAAEDATIVEVRAAAESLSVARTADPHLLTRAAYHLGNRHVPLQIGAGWLAYGHDHVLDDMVRGLGLEVEAQHAAFEPEAGAFGHDRPHGHGHTHDEGGHHHHH